MYILLEEGMIIEHGDEALGDDYVWDSVGLAAGEKYRSTHFVMRRKIDTIEELVTSYNRQSKKCG